MLEYWQCENAIFLILEKGEILEKLKITCSDSPDFKYKYKKSQSPLFTFVVSRKASDFMTHWGLGATTANGHVFKR